MREIPSTLSRNTTDPTAPLREARKEVAKEGVSLTRLLLIPISERATNERHPRDQPCLSPLSLSLSLSLFSHHICGMIDGRQLYTAFSDVEEIELISETYRN